MSERSSGRLGGLLLVVLVLAVVVRGAAPSSDGSVPKDVNGCIAAMKRAQDRNDPELLERILRTGMSLARTDWERFLVRYHLSCLHFSRGDYGKCILAGREALAFGRSGESWRIYGAQVNKVGEACFKAKEYDAALEVVLPYMERHDGTGPIHRRNRMLLGEILFAQKKYERAEGEFRTLLKMPEMSVQETAKCNWYCGRIGERTGRPSEAMRAYRENLALDGKWFTADSRSRLEELQKERHKRNQLPDGGFENGGRGAWNRMIDQSYLPGHDDWVPDASEPFQGRFSLRNENGCPLQLLAEGDVCPGCFSIHHRASVPGARLKVEVFTYRFFNRLRLAEGVCISEEGWRRYALEIKVRWIRFDKGATPLVVVLTPLDRGCYWVDAGQLESGGLTPYKDYRVDPSDLEDAKKRLLTRYDLPPLTADAGGGEGVVPGRHGFSVSSAVSADAVPVDVALPFGPGEWLGGGNGEVVSGDGRRHTVQMRVISRWPRDGSVRSLGVNFTTSLRKGMNRFHLQNGEPQARKRIEAAASPPLRLCAWDICGNRYEEHEVVRKVESEGGQFREVLRRGLLVDACRRAFLEYTLRTRRFWKDGILEIQATLTNPEDRAQVLRKAAVFLDSGRKGAGDEYLQDYDLQKKAFRRPPDGGCGAVSGPGGTLVYREASLRHPVKLSLDEQGMFIGWIWPDTARPVILSRKSSLFREFVHSPDQGSQVMARLGHSPVAMADPEDFIRTGFFVIPIGRVTGRMRRTRRLLLPYEKFSLRDERILNDPGRILHGVFNYGDVHGDCGWGNLESFLDMSEILYGLGLGDIEILGWGLKRSMHYRDYDVVDGAACYHSPNHSGGTRSDFSHSWPQGIVLHYLLTGSRRSSDVIRQVIGRYCERPVDDRHIQGSRSLGRYLVGLSDFYALTGSRAIRRRFVDQLDHVEKHGLPAGKRDRTIFSWHGRTDPFHVWYGCYALMQMYRLTGEERMKQSFLREMRASLNMDFFRHDLREMWCGLPEEEAWPVMLGFHSRHRGSLFYPNMRFYAEVTGDGRCLGMARLAAYADSLRGERVWPMDSWRLAVLQDIDEDRWIADAWRMLWAASSPGIRNGDFSESGKWFSHWHLPADRQMSYDDAVESWPLPEKKEFPALLREYQTRQKLVSPWRGYSRNLAYLDRNEFLGAAPSLRVTLSREWDQGKTTRLGSVPVRVTAGHWRIRGAFRCNLAELGPENLIQWNFTVPEKKIMRHYISMRAMGDDVRFFIRYCKETDLRNLRAGIHPAEKRGWRRFQWEFDCPADGIGTLQFLLRLGSSATRTDIWFDDLEAARTGDVGTAAG